MCKTVKTGTTGWTSLNLVTVHRLNLWCWLKKRLGKPMLMSKPFCLNLDGVGPIDNRTSMPLWKWTTLPHCHNCWTNHIFKLFTFLDGLRTMPPLHFYLLWHFFLKWVHWSWIYSGALSALSAVMKSADLLEVFFAQSNLSFWQICAKKCPRRQKQVHKRCKIKIKNVKIVKMYDYSSLGVQIWRYCPNSSKFCAVARLHDRNILKLWKPVL